MADGLTAKQQRFVDEYLIDLNASQAAIRSGYSEATARSQGQRMLTNADIAEAVNRAIEDRAKRVGVTQDMVLRELAKMGFSNMLDYLTPRNDGLVSIDFSALTREQASAIQEVTIDQVRLPEKDEKGNDVRADRVKFKLADKRGSLELLGKHLGMFKDKLEVTGSEGGPLLVQKIERVIVDPASPNS